VKTDPVRDKKSKEKKKGKEGKKRDKKKKDKKKGQKRERSHSESDSSDHPLAKKTKTEPSTDDQDATRWMTPSERAYELVQQQRLQERIAKKTELSHQQKIAQYNARLEKEPEIHDIPKVGPG